MKVLAHGAKNPQTAREFNLAGLRRVIDLSLFNSDEGYQGVIDELDGLSRYGMMGIYTIRIADPEDPDGRIDDPSKHPRQDLDRWVERLAQAVQTAARGGEYLEAPVPLMISCTNEPAGGPGQIRTRDGLEEWCIMMPKIFETLTEVQQAYPGMVSFASPAFATWNPITRFLRRELQGPRDLWRGIVQTTLFETAQPFISYADVHLHTETARDLLDEVEMMRAIWHEGTPISTEFGIAKHDPEATPFNVVSLHAQYSMAWSAGFSHVCAAPFHPHGSNEVFQWSASRERKDGPKKRLQPWANHLEQIATRYNHDDQKQDEDPDPGALPSEDE